MSIHIAEMSTTFEVIETDSGGSFEDVFGDVVDNVMAQLEEMRRLEDQAWADRYPDRPREERGTRRWRVATTLELSVDG